MAKIIGLPKDKKEQDCILDFLNKDFTDFMLKCSYIDSYRTNLKSSNSNTTLQIFLSLILGDKGACLVFALSFLNCRGVKDDTKVQDFLSHLATSIGIKSGDKSIFKLAKDDDISKDLPEAWGLADKCIGLMQRNSQEIGLKHVLLSEALARAKAFDEVVKKASGMSILDNILPCVFHFERYVETLYPKGFDAQNIHNITPIKNSQSVSAAGTEESYYIPYQQEYDPSIWHGEVSLAGQSADSHESTPCCPKPCVLL